MKKQMFNENNSLELIEVISISKFSGFPPKNNEFTVSRTPKVLNKVFTDGEIVKIDESKETINEYYIGKKRYQGDEKITRNIYLRNHTYAVVYTIAEEYMHVGNIRGFFKVIKDVKIYLKDKRDLTAIRKAKKTIQMIQEHNRSIDYSSMLSMLLSRNETPKKIEYEKSQENIYILKR